MTMGKFIGLVPIYMALFILSTCETTTHWFVTEEGRIHPEHDSVFDLRRPYDMVAMLRQETRAASLDTLKQELLERKLEIDANEDKDTGLEARFYKTDDDCIRAGQPLPDFDLYVSTVLSMTDMEMQINEFINMREPPSPYPIAPSCVEYPLDFSIHAFEHLEGVALRGQVPNSPEPDLLYQVVGRGQSVEDFGHRVYKAMNKNQTSWVLYNLAAFYWRVKGNSYESIECLRRSLHFSPRKDSDVALLSLANVLHRGRFSSEAAIVLHAALDVGKSQSKHHFTLGNVYAVLGDYNKSSICYENALTLLPTFEAAVDRWHAVLCHRKLEKALENQHKSLQRTLEDLKEYQKRHEEWQQQNDKLISEQAGADGKLERRKAFNDNRIRNQVSSRIEDCVIIDNANDAERQIVRCSFRNQEEEERFDYSVLPSSVRAQTRETLDSLHVSLLRVQNESRPEEKLTTLYTLPPPLFRLSDDVDDRRGSNDGVDEDDDDDGEEVSEDDDDGSSAFSEIFHQPSDGDFGQPQRSALYREKIDNVLHVVNRWNWPSKPDCDANVKAYPCHWTGYPTVFLSPSRKGISVQPLFSTVFPPPSPSLSTPQPPVCDEDDDVIAFPQWLMDELKDDKLPYFSDLSTTTLSAEPGLIEFLREICDPPCPSAEAEDFLPLLHSALSRPNGSNQWVVYVIASLYWRATGSGLHANVCAIKAAQIVPKDYRDVVLISFAANLFRQGYAEAALSVVKLAESYNDEEAPIHFFLGSLWVIAGNLEEAIRHYIKSMKLDPHSAQVFRYYRMLGCFIRHRMVEEDTIPSIACIKTSPPISLDFASEKYLDCKSVELGDDLVQRRCWLKASTLSPSLSTKNPDDQKGGHCVSFSKASGTNPNSGDSCVLSNDHIKSSSTEEAPTNREKRKYYETKSLRSQYALEYLEQDVEEVHAKLRKDWFCMDSECNRILVQPRKLSNGLTIRIGYEPEADEGVKNGDAKVESLRNGDDGAESGKIREKVEFRLVFFVDDNERRIPVDEGCFAFGDGSFSHGCTRGPEDLLRFLATSGRDELQLLQSAEISLALPPPGGSSSPVAKGAPPSTAATVITASRSRAEKPRGREKESRSSDKKSISNEHKLKKSTGDETSSENGERVALGSYERKAPNIPSDPTTLIPNEARGLAVRPPSSRQCPQIIENWKAFTNLDLGGSGDELTSWDFFSSLWLSVQAKGVDLLKHIDVDIPLTREDLSLKPFCTSLSPSTIRGGENLPPPKVITCVDDLPSVKRRYANTLKYEPEEALSDFLTLLGGSLTSPLSLDEIGSRVTMSLEQDGGSWILYNIAALYWRVIGNVGQAIECLRHAIAYAELDAGRGHTDASDVGYVSLGNVLHRCRRHDEAVKVLTHALAVNGSTVMAHLAIANALAAKRDWDKAERFYLSTLFFQPGFRPAETALLVVQCRKIEDNEKNKKKKLKKKKGGVGGGSRAGETRPDNRGTRSGKDGGGGAEQGAGGSSGGGLSDEQKKSKGDGSAMEKGAKRK